MTPAERQMRRALEAANRPADPDRSSPLDEAITVLVVIVAAGFVLATLMEACGL